MRVRSSWVGAMLLVGALVPLTSCSVNPALTSIAVSPGSVETSMTNGLYIAFTAIGSYTRPGHAAVTKDITDQVTWTSSWPQFVVVNSTGIAMVTGYGSGSGAINAAAPGFHGDIVGSATFKIDAPAATGAVKTLSLVPAGKDASGAVQFKAIGKTGDGESIDVTSQTSWVSTDSEVATIDKASGLVSTLGPGRTTITAFYRNQDGTTALGKTYYNVTR
jgi:trimeric autotransporter adhesin